jgi:hypothetical protein
MEAKVALRYLVHRRRFSAPKIHAVVYQVVRVIVKGVV